MCTIMHIHIDVESLESVVCTIRTMWMKSLLQHKQFIIHTEMKMGAFRMYQTHEAMKKNILVGQDVINRSFVNNHQQHQYDNHNINNS